MRAAAKLPGPMAIALADIRTDGGTQSRAELSRETISDYAEVFTSGAAMPPVVAFYDGESYWLADGFHRCSGARAAGLTEILADVRQGSRRDAVLYSVGANDTHGLRRTNADKRRAVTLLVRDEEWSAWSDKVIADRCGVSREFVNRIRAEQPVIGSQVRTGADGKTRKIPAIQKWNQCHRHGCKFEWGDKCPVCADREAKGLDDPEPEDPDLDGAEDEWSDDDAPESDSLPAQTGTIVPGASDTLEALECIAAQRDADPDYQSFRQTQALLAQSMPPTRAQRMIDFVLDGGEIALLRLGLDWTVTAESLKAAYRSASKRVHPDLGGTAGEFQQLTADRDLVAKMLGGA